MATDEAYTAYFRGLGTAALCDVLQAIRGGQSPPGAPQPWERGRGFEYLVMRAFEAEQSTIAARVHYALSVPAEDLVGPALGAGSQGAVEQIDGVLHLEHLTFLVECKAESSVDLAPLAKLRNQLLRRPAGVVGLLVVLDDVTPAAAMLARFMMPQAVLIVAGEEFPWGLRNARLLEMLLWKHDQAVLRGVPDARFQEMYNV